jgi:hypothetical protein
MKIFLFDKIDNILVKGTRREDSGKEHNFHSKLRESHISVNDVSPRVCLLHS